MESHNNKSSHHPGDGAGTVLRIAKWDEVFERADTRKVKSLTWVAMPLGFTSHGYQAMLDEFQDKAAAIYGCWCALVAYAASCTVRGTLATSRGTPTPITHLARVTGFDAELYRQLIDWAEQPEIGWLERVPTAQVMPKPEEKRSSGEPPDNLPAHPETPGKLPDYQTGQDRTGQNRTTTRPDQTRDRTSVVGRSSWDLSWGWEELSRLGRKFRRVSGCSERAIDSAALAIVLGLDLSCDRGFASDLAASLRSQQIRKPKKYAAAAVRNRCGELGVCPTELEAAVRARIAQVRPDEVVA